MDTTIFLLLSGMTGIIEVGAVIYGVLHGYSPLEVLFLVLAYQLGCFFPTNITLSKSIKTLLCCVSLLSTCIYIFFPSYPILLLIILSISPCLQMARSAQKSSVGTGIKRISRIIGFALSPLFSPLFIIAIALFVLVVTVTKSEIGKTSTSFQLISFPYLIMVVHQMHYFSYAYIILVQASRLDNYNGFMSAFIFVLGWITYTSAQYIFRGKHFFRYLIIGHIFLMTILIAMAITSSEIIRIVLWVLTGFGGGTVFCIKELIKQNETYQNHSLETAENYGHIMGVICCILLLTIFDNMTAPIIFASICAAFTVILTSLFLNRRRIQSS